MKKFYCRCGRRVFFDSLQCVSCGAVLGFEPDSMQMISGWQTEHGQFQEAGQSNLGFSVHNYEFCSNRADYGVCNWLKPANDGRRLCCGCRFNRTIPNLDRPENLKRWRQFEVAKKRLLYGLMVQHLPIANGFDEPEKGLLLDFIEDERSAPDHYPESFVSTGFSGGVITINAIEADDAARESIRVAMNESYRTLLGHLRHESGHYYWFLLNPKGQLLDDFIFLFGDPGQDYKAALERHYRLGPIDNWQEYYISAYSSAHPLEDWAETWAHYLLIHDALESAYANDLLEFSPMDTPLRTRIQSWADLSVAFNEINRSSGLRDTYPFVVTSQVTRKMQFVEKVINLLAQATH